MSSPNTAAEILAMYVPSPSSTERRPSTFLSLAPTTSASYPTTPLPKSPSPKSPVQVTAQAAKTTEQAIPDVPNAEAIEMELKARRSSSLSSQGSNGKRFLKLGPVHFGEDRDGLGDWSEAIVAE